MKWKRAAALCGLLAVLSGCGGASEKPGPVGAPEGRSTPSEMATAPVEAPAPVPVPVPAPAPQPVTAAEVGAVVERLSQGGWTLTWEGPTAGKAALSTRNDRFYQPSQGQGCVQVGLRSWHLLTHKAGRIEWDGPYAGIIPQRPFISELCRRPELWGAAVLLTGSHVLHRQTQPDGTERWVAALEPAGVEVNWHLQPVKMTALELVVKLGLPVSFRARVTGEKGPETIHGRYTWEEPALLAPPRTELTLGLFHVWLGQTRAEVEPFVLSPSKREREADGSEWVYASGGLSVKYDPSGKVVTLAQTQGSLLNGLQVGDEKARVLHLFPNATETRPETLTQHYPDGSRLEIPVYGGKVFGFWAVAAGH